MLSHSSGARSEGGRLFQVAGPNITAKLRWPVQVRNEPYLPLPSQPKLVSLTHFPTPEGCKAELALGCWLVTYRNKCPEPGHGRPS